MTRCEFLLRFSWFLRCYALLDVVVVRLLTSMSSIQVFKCPNILDKTCMTIMTSKPWKRKICRGSKWIFFLSCFQVHGLVRQVFSLIPSQDKETLRKRRGRTNKTSLKQHMITTMTQEHEKKRKRVD